MVTKHSSTAHTSDMRVALTAQHLYAAECALRDAHQSHVDAWIAAASERLHIALTEHLAAQAASRRVDADLPRPQSQGDLK
jgi:hypothetical protein